MSHCISDSFTLLIPYKILSLTLISSCVLLTCPACSLGPALANSFVGYYKEKSFSQTQKPPTYFKYIDDMFAISDHEAEADEFLAKLNCLHPSLRFTFEERES